MTQEAPSRGVNCKPILTVSVQKSMKLTNWCRHGTDLGTNTHYILLTIIPSLGQTIENSTFVPTGCCCS